MNDELSQLKAQADQMGLAYKTNIGVEALRSKVSAALKGTPPPADEPETPSEAKSDALPVVDAPVTQASVEPDANRSVAKPETAQERRTRVMKEATALVRCRITCLNPAKAHMKGEVITTGNRITGAISKYVAFGETTDNGYHVPKMIFDQLKERKFNSLRSEKGKNGVFHPVQRLVPEFAIEVLEPLTREELDRLARTQAAAAGQ